jgi:O-antigen ligase
MKIPRLVERTIIEVSLPLTLATQLRIPSIPVGVGEAGIALWTIMTLLKTRSAENTSVSSNPVLDFWKFGVPLLLVGTLISLIISIPDGNRLYDVFAYLFAIAFILALVSKAKSESNYVEFLLPRVISILCFLELGMLIYSTFSPVLGPVALIQVDGDRFVGFSTNPNQIAIAIAPVPFLCLFLLNRAKSLPIKAYYLLLFLINLILGIRANSQGLMVSWKISFFVFAAGTYLTETFDKKKTVRVDFVVLGSLLFTSVLLNIDFLIELSQSYIKNDLVGRNGRDDGDGRLTLFPIAIEAIKNSPFFGLGPGSHAGIDKPFEGVEAHNTILDWGMQTGVVGIFLYLSMIWRLMIDSFKQKYFVLSCGIISTALYSTSGFVLRHPLFWFFILSIALFNKNSKAKYSSMATEIR